MKNIVANLIMRIGISRIKLHQFNIEKSFTQFDVLLIKKQ